VGKESIRGSKIYVIFNRKYLQYYSGINRFITKEIGLISFIEINGIINREFGQCLAMPGSSPK
jgi:hypothetical protein